MGSAIYMQTTDYKGRKVRVRDWKAEDERDRDEKAKPSKQAEEIVIRETKKFLGNTGMKVDPTYEALVIEAMKGAKAAGPTGTPYLTPQGKFLGSFEAGGPGGAAGPGEGGGIRMPTDWLNLGGGDGFWGGPMGRGGAAGGAGGAVAVVGFVGWKAAKAIYQLIARNLFTKKTAVAILTTAGIAATEEFLDELAENPDGMFAVLGERRLAVYFEDVLLGIMGEGEYNTFANSAGQIIRKGLRAYFS